MSFEHEYISELGINKHKLIPLAHLGFSWC